MTKLEYNPTSFNTPTVILYNNAKCLNILVSTGMGIERRSTVMVTSLRRHVFKTFLGHAPHKRFPPCGSYAHCSLILNLLYGSQLFITSSERYSALIPLFVTPRLLTLILTVITVKSPY